MHQTPAKFAFTQPVAHSRSGTANGDIWLIDQMLVKSVERRGEESAEDSDPY